MSLQIRKSSEAHANAIAEVVCAAFDDGSGPELVDLISKLIVDPTAQPSLSLVATIDDQIVGHVLYTHVSIRGAKTPAPAAILAPLSVHPAHQSKGIGGRLIEAGLQQLREAGVDLVFVLGYPAYYNRHGFAAAGARGLDAPYPIPPEHAEAWMVQALRPGAMEGVTGQLACAKSLDDPKLWRE